MPDHLNISGAKSRTALLIGSGLSAHHFVGIADALAVRGWVAQRETLQLGIPLRVTRGMIRQACVVVHADGVNANALNLRNAAAAGSVPTLLQMDGVLEYANTFLNRLAGNRFLRPAPADVVFASGFHDRAILRALGNRAAATGLPRLAGFADRVRACREHERPVGILVATANQPAFTPGGRMRLLSSLEHIKSAAVARALPIRWRVGPEIAQHLGVENESCELAESIACVRAVLTGASTLAVESMIAGRPTAIIHPHPWPLWIPCAWRYEADTQAGYAQDRAAMEALLGQDTESNVAAADSIEKTLMGAAPLVTSSINELLDALLDPSDAFMLIQNRIVRRYHCPNPAARVARMIEAASFMISTNEEGPSDFDPGPLKGVESGGQIPSGGVIEAFEKLCRKGATRVAVVASRRPSEELAWLAEHRSAQLAGFVVIGEPDGASLLGVRTVGYDQIDGLLSADVPLLIAPQDDCSLVVATHRLRGLGTHVTVSSDPSSVEYIDQVIECARSVLRHGEVHTTLEEALLPGAYSYPPDRILDGQRPAMLVLKGDEIDFEIYQRSRPWRDAGTIVHSLRWNDAELSSPERFASLVAALKGQSYAIYGGGLHTRRLLKYSTLTSRPCMILDDDASTRSGNDAILGDLPVHDPQSVDASMVGAVVLSSLRHEPSLWRRSAKLRRTGIRVLPLYESLEMLEAHSAKVGAGI